jgi:molybdopterin molybdotransferase
MCDDLERQPSCQDPGDEARTYEAARALVESAAAPVTGREVVALRSALGRVVDRPVMSPADVPPHRNSAMDGYAMAFADVPGEGHRELEVAGTAWAGRPFAGVLAPGQCVRIMTGAKMPDGVDTVVIQEHAQAVGEHRVRIDSRPRAGQNVRHPGEDIARGQVVLASGKRVGPAELGLLASLGIAEVGVHRRVRAAFFTSGDELRSLGQPLGEGEIYDSNRYTLFGMLHELGVEILDMGVVRDRPEELQRALDDAGEAADVVLTTGGISVGAADHLHRLVAERGEVLFSKVAIKPGRPVTFGRWGRSWFFGLPGNPVAAMVTFYEFVRPLLRRLQGESPVERTLLRARSEGPMPKSPGRTEIRRGLLFTGADGELRVRTAGRQGSGVLSSMSTGNCFVLLGDARGPVAAGDLVTVEPFAMLRF